MIQKIKNFLFKNSTNHQITTKNTLWLGIGEIGSRIIKLFIFVQAARILGVSEWGVFSYGLALIGVFSIFSDIGTNAVVLREVAKKSTEQQRYISTGFFIKTALTIISALVLCSTVLVTNNTTIKPLIPLVAIMLFIDSIREFGFTLNRASEKMETEAIIKLLANTLLAAVAITAIHYIPTASSLMVAYIVAGILSLLLLSYTVRKYIPLLIENFDRTLIRSIFIEAWPIGVVAVFGSILSSIDTIILGWLKTTTDVGLYAAAQKPLQLLWLAPGLMSTALLPYFSRTAGSDDVGFSKILGRAITACLAIMTPLVMICIVGARPIITLLFGPTYSAAVPVLQISAIGGLIVIPSIFLSNALLAHHKQKVTLQFIAIGALSNIILSFILIPPYGMYGAAISYTLSQLISNICILVLTRRIPSLRFYIRPSELKTDIKKIFKF
jgi:O-antigen/teichoic acid export membrane protein